MANRDLIRNRVKELRSKISKANDLLEDIAHLLEDRLPEAIDYIDHQEFLGNIYNLIDDLEAVDRRAAHLTFDSYGNITSSTDIDEDEYEEIEYSRDTPDWGGQIRVGDMYMERGDEDGIYYIWDDIEATEDDEHGFYTGSLEGVKDYNYKLYKAWCKKYNVK